MPRVIPGHGRLQTSSPTSPRRGRPSGPKTSVSWPSAGKPSATGFAGSVMQVARKHAPTSVPPDSFTIGTPPPPTCSASQRYGSLFHGSPVVQIAFSDDMSVSGSPFGSSARISVGETPSIVTRSDSTSFQRRSSGKSGAPSPYTTVAPPAPPPTTIHGPLIPPLSVGKWVRSPGFTLVWDAPSPA